MTSKVLEYSAQVKFLPVMFFLIIFGAISISLFGKHTTRDHDKLICCVPQKNKGAFGWVNDDLSFLGGLSL